MALPPYVARIVRGSAPEIRAPSIGAESVASAKRKGGALALAWISRQPDPIAAGGDRVIITETATGREICARGVAASKWIRAAPIEPTARTAAARARATGDRLKRIEISAFPIEAIADLRAAAGKIKARALAARATSRRASRDPIAAALDHAAHGRAV
jgi:hypothetical protein